MTDVVEVLLDAARAGTLPAVPAAPAGRSVLRVLVADAGAVLGLAGRTPALAPIAAMPEARQASIVLPVGSHRVRVARGGSAVSYAVALLPGFTTTFVVGAGEVHHLYVPTDPAQAVRDNPGLLLAAGWAAVDGDRTAFAPRTFVASFPELPDAHVLAALLDDPERRDDHFGRAMAAGLPIAARGFDELLAWIIEQSAAAHTPPPALPGTRAPGAWTAISPAPVSHVVDRDGRRVAGAAPPPAIAGRIERADGTVLCSMFVVAPGVAICPRATALQLASEGDDGAWTQPAGVVRIGEATSAIRGIAPAVTSGTRLPAPLRPVALALDPSAAATPVAFAAASPGMRCAVVGYPRTSAYVPDDAFVRNFADVAGTLHAMHGTVTRVHADGTFEHDAYTCDGLEGAPVIDLASGAVLGMHLGPTPRERRSTAIGARWLSQAHAIDDRREAVAPPARPPPPLPPPPPQPAVIVTLPITVSVTVGTPVRRS